MMMRGGEVDRKKGGKDDQKDEGDEPIKLCDDLVQ